MQIAFYLFIILLGAQVCGYTILAFQLLQNVVERKKEQVILTIKRGLALMLFSGFFFQILPGSNIIWWPVNTIFDLSFTKTILGKSIYLGQPHKKIESEPSFNGDGYSYSEYELSNRQSKYFIDPPNKFFKVYPKKGIREDWKISKWTKTPLREKDQAAFDFALSDSNNETDLKLKKIIKESENFYSYRYYNNSQDYSHESKYISNVDFYIISPSGNILIVINHNT